MFFCDPCYLLFRTREDGITHILTSPVHNAALLARNQNPRNRRQLTPYEFAATQLTYMVPATPAQAEAAVAAEQAASLIALATAHAANPAFRAGMRAAVASPSPPARPPPRGTPRVPIRYGVRVTAPTSIESFVWTYAPGDLDSVRSFRTALANACIASGCDNYLDWEVLCARRWVVNAAGIDLPELLTRIRCEADVALVKRAGLLPGDGWNRVIEIGAPN